MAATLPGLRRLPALFATTFACALATQASAFDAPAAPDAPTPLDPIVITGQRLDKAGTVTVLDAAALTRQGVTDMQNMARYAPLVSVPGAASGSGNVWDGAGNTGFNIRGVEGNRVGLDLDGIELPEAAPKPDASTLNGFGVGRDYVDPETLRSVTIQSGTAPAGAGAQGLGGNVSFVTKAPEDYVSEARPTYAEYKFGSNRANDMRMHALTGAAQSGALKALAVLVHRDGKELGSTGSAPLNPDDWDSDALLAKLSWTPWTGHRFTATIDAFRAEHDREYDNKQGALYPEGATQAGRTRRDRFGIDHLFQAPAHGSIRSRAVSTSRTAKSKTSRRPATSRAASRCCAISRPASTTAAWASPATPASGWAATTWPMASMSSRPTPRVHGAKTAPSSTAAPSR
ncbi:outer membrane receptor protein involved in Fe transport [Massilia sp. UYP32]